MLTRAVSVFVLAFVLMVADLAAAREARAQAARNADDLLIVDCLLPGQVRRLAGSNRYATSVEVSKATFPDGAARVYLATGRNFPDALAGGPVAANGPGPLLLVPGGCVPSSVRAEIERLGPERLVLLGGSGAVSGALASFQAC